MATTTYVPEGVGETEALPLPSRLHEWIVTVDHKRLGILYIATSLFFFAVAGILAALMRLQLAVPNATFLPPDVFNRLFTMHGTTMVFLVGMPFFAGLANYLTPLMLGARDMAFPRLNAFGYWIFLFGRHCRSRSARPRSADRASRTIAFAETRGSVAVNCSCFNRRSWEISTAPFAWIACRLVPNRTWVSSQSRRGRA
jgi:hypothetical protein